VKAAIYARFSSDKQTDRSIEDQVALCRAICEREGLIVSAVYDDRAISGASTLNRLGWQRLMRDAKAGKFKVVVAEALDRISRDQEDLAGIHKRLNFAGAEIRTAQDGIAGDIHIGVKGLLGSLYLKDLAQKTRADRLALSAMAATTAGAVTVIGPYRESLGSLRSTKRKRRPFAKSSRTISRQDRHEISLPP
jgi:DNA invertase Pin-like site-specific DNA recombinase